MLPSMITPGEAGAAREGLALAGVYWVEENTSTGEWDFSDGDAYDLHIP